MSKTYYWSIAFGSQSVSASLWTREEEETSIVGFSDSIPLNSVEELQSATDAALSSLTSIIPEEAGEPEKTVFGVLGNWVLDGAIKKEKLMLIRTICEELGLNPVGFVIFSESLAHWIKQEEGGPMTAVVISINKEDLEVSLFRLGNLQGTINVGRSSSISEDIVEALTRFGTTEPIPSRFLIFGANESSLSDLSSEISDTDWEEVSNGRVSFLHNPKVEIVNYKDLLVAVSVAGSSEMGPVSKLVVPDATEGNISDDHDNLSKVEVEPNELGFVMDSDISSLDGDEAAISSFGEDPEIPHESEPEFSHVTHGSKAFHLKNKILSPFKHLRKAKGLLKKKQDLLPVEQGLSHTFSKTRGRKSKVRFALIGIIGASLFVGLIFAWYFLPNAEVTIFVSPRVLTTTENVSLRTDISEPDFSQKLLPAQSLNKSVSGSDSTSTTGVKVVGDKAHGSVTVRNGTSSGIKLPQGALLTGPNDLKFSIDESASVSAATSPSEPGTVTVNATASSIGAEYNVGQSSTFKVGSFASSEIDAVGASDFSGGSSRQINAVSKADVDGLERSLLASLTDKAKEELSGEISADDTFIPDSVTVTVDSKTFNRKVGDEADSLSLDMSVTAQGLSIPRDAINKMASTLLSNQVPSGFSFRPEETQSDFNVQKGTNGASATISLSAHLLPDIKPEEVARSVRGKNLTRAQEFLSTIPGFVKATITISPSFPSPVKVLPWILKHIDVSVEGVR